MQLMELVGRLDLAPREIFALLLVSNSTEIEITFVSKSWSTSGRRDRQTVSNVNEEPPSNRMRAIVKSYREHSTSINCNAG